MNLSYFGLQNQPINIQSASADDVLWRNILALPYFRSLLRAVESQFYKDIDLPSPTLDVGCGEGHFAELTFTRKIEVGLDPAYESLQEALTRQAYNLLTEADGGKMPYPDKYFASAFSNSVLEHIPHVEKVLHETARVLKPGAVFAFCVPNHRFNSALSVSNFFDKVGLKFLGNLYRSFFTFISRHRHMDSPEVWKKRLEEAGFTIEKWWHYFPPKSLTILEWGHYLGLPSLIVRKLTSRWILVPTKWNLAVIHNWLRPHTRAVASEDGVCTFYIARRNGS